MLNLEMTEITNDPTFIAALSDNSGSRNLANICNTTLGSNNSAVESLTNALKVSLDSYSGKISGECETKVVNNCILKLKLTVNSPVDDSMVVKIAGNPIYAFNNNSKAFLLNLAGVKIFEIDSNKRDGVSSSESSNNSSTICNIAP
ncbi:hypothetical protein WICMUC_000979 [Wickerhamomyces mucosus]|uniref:Uncharacterized protein n=1 Tax=Wickerhamomyces mucosus TaxID=1378264 RepID=A0A9P8PY51_9ASCO|nr:hypothetical protein WICMUC_000979 [Wickerhamomyces mucosus]